MFVRWPFSYLSNLTVTKTGVVRRMCRQVPVVPFALDELIIKANAADQDEPCCHTTSNPIRERIGRVRKQQDRSFICDSVS